MFDILICGALIVDGSGSEGYIGDVGVEGGKISAVGRLGGAAAVEVIEAAAASHPASLTYTATQTPRCFVTTGVVRSSPRALQL